MSESQTIDTNDADERFRAAGERLAKMQKRIAPNVTTGRIGAPSKPQRWSTDDSSSRVPA